MLSLNGHLHAEPEAPSTNSPSWLEEHDFPLLPLFTDQNAQKGPARMQHENLSHVLFIGGLNQSLEAGPGLSWHHSVSDPLATDLCHSTHFDLSNTGV